MLQQGMLYSITYVCSFSGAANVGRSYDQYMEQKNMSEIKCCPFCGEIPVVESEVVPGIERDREVWNLYCHKCGCLQYVQDSRVRAIEAWNKRVDNTSGEE